MRKRCLIFHGICRQFVATRKADNYRTARELVDPSNNTAFDMKTSKRFTKTVQEYENVCIRTAKDSIKVDGSNEATVSDGSTKNDCNGTLYVKDVINVLRK